MPCDEPAGGGLPDDYIYDVLAVEMSRLPEEGLHAVVMVRGAVLEAVHDSIDKECAAEGPRTSIR